MPILLRQRSGRIIEYRVDGRRLMQFAGHEQLYNVAKAGRGGPVRKSVASCSAGHQAACWSAPSFFQDNLLDSFRGPDQAAQTAGGELLESFAIVCRRCGGYHLSGKRGRTLYMILPHESCRMPGLPSRLIRKVIYDEMIKRATSGSSRPDLDWWGLSVGGVMTIITQADDA